ncbi:acyl-CoA dehydrogenase family protein [Streptomyces spiramenti]|uniref:Acyl-CoA dehydrogenase n=1 Tax=Streptomyces spiramenti TaxID=2720606 RepID=A0ABX1AVC3_9ACTN|nr:acyl-CoA dehydrogenase family protein [Streptomyces spiramenti]NJP68217.1 acyl-CoA dehydrogenase [Streptomyces spiramenti]
MPTDDTLTREQLVERAAALAPRLLESREETLRDDRLPDAAVEALTEAGIFRLRLPGRYGGYEADARTMVAVAAELARIDGSVGWTAAVSWIPTHMACMFPDVVQDEVFADPGVRLCGTLSPSAQARTVPGGIRVSGEWGFVSGAPHATWQQIIAVVLGDDRPPLPVVALVPMSELRILDDWDAHGLRGTGSPTTVAEDVFVPAERVLPLPEVLASRAASAATQGLAAYRAPLLPVAAASSVGVAVGLARAARDAFLERLPGRPLTYTHYDRQSDAPLTHRQLAEVALACDEAAFHAERLADQVDDKNLAGEEWSAAERARARADLGAAVRRAREAATTAAEASGGSSVRRAVPAQRIAADVRAVGLHALMNPDVNTELYGRVLCGLEPGTPYV